MVEGIFFKKINLFIERKKLKISKNFQQFKFKRFKNIYYISRVTRGHFQLEIAILRHFLSSVSSINYFEILKID